MKNVFMLKYELVPLPFDKRGDKGDYPLLGKYVQSLIFAGIPQSHVLESSLMGPIRIKRK